MNPRDRGALSGAHSERFGLDLGAGLIVSYAPGRVNLIGEHTDYNEGFVLPCAIDFGTGVALRPRPDRSVRVRSTSFPDRALRFELDQPLHRDPAEPWGDYVKGVYDRLIAHGHQLEGAELLISGDVPQGAGLSSSASLQVALAKALAAQHQIELGPTELALLAQEAENEFVGCQCGVMDQLAASASEEGRATLIDCRDLALSPVTLPEELGVLIVDSKVKRGLVESAYNERRAQCEAAARALGVSSLRELNLERLERGAAQLSALELRRARHVISENARTLATVEALKRADLKALGEHMRASHESLRLDFEVTVPQVDLIASILNEVIGDQGGARMTGGGFGGCVVALAPQALLAELRAAIEGRYERETGLRPAVYSCQPRAGARLL